MKSELISEIQRLNPWLNDPLIEISNKDYISRIQSTTLLDPEWDSLALILVGPRQAGKTTLGKFISQTIIDKGRYKQLLYLNCDLRLIREWIKGIAFIDDIANTLKLNQYILFIDEVQRLQNPGLTLKAIVDLKLPIKLIASGSSQLEIKSHVQEHLTGRHFESLILPLSWEELNNDINFESQMIYGCYPQVVISNQKQLLLQQLYSTYINKDIIEILKISKSDVMEKLIGLLAHCSGQLTNLQQLATDCSVSIPTISHYISILEKTYVIQAVRPFVGNKRQELTSTPIYYFVDVGFRNQCLYNFNTLNQRTDAGLLVESVVFEEIYKFKAQHFKTFKIHYWRTKGGAEVDFVLYQNIEKIIPIEIKYSNFNQFKLTRSYRSFIESYKPKIAFLITKNFQAEKQIDDTKVICLPLSKLHIVMNMLSEIL